MNYYWQILGISPTNDGKRIKQAYAQKLKQCKPDEDPQGFQELHNAYKVLLSTVKSKPKKQYAPVNLKSESSQKKRQHVDLIERDESILPPGIELENTPPSSETETEAEYTQIDYSQEELLPTTKQDFINIEYEPTGKLEPSHTSEGDFQDLSQLIEIERKSLIDQIDSIIDNWQKLNLVENWHFLQENKALDDLRLKLEISEYILDYVLHIYGDYRKLSPKVLHYLDSFFQWSEQTDVLSDEERAETIQKIFKKIPIYPSILEKKWWFTSKHHDQPIVAAGYYTRIFAFILDYIIIYQCLRLYSYLIADLGEKYFLAAGCYLLAALLMEALPFQGTIGKLIFRIKVTNKKGSRINIFHNFYRVICFTAATIAIKITVWINFFLQSEYLLHDHVSYSRVIKR